MHGSGDDDAPLRAGYLAQQYPQLTQTFITTEVDALRRRGVDIRVASVVRGQELPGARDVRVISTAARSLRGAAAAASFSARHPGRVLRAVRVRRSLPGEFGTDNVQVRMPGLLALAHEWERWGVDVVHAHFAWAGAAAAMVLSRLLQVPWSMTVHANDMYAAERNLASKLADADRVVTVCDYNRRVLIDEWSYDREVPIVICGVEDVPDEGGGVAPAAAPGDDADVVAVGRLIEKKGFDVLIRAVAEIPVGSRPRRVVIVGDGPLRDELASLAASERVADIVEFAGALDHQSSLELIRRARVVVAPFRIAADGDRDSMPVVVKEAMIRGRAVIGADVAAMGEMLDDDTGVLVPPDAPAALAAALVRLLGDDDLRARLGHRARARARAEFLIDTSAAAMHGVLTGVARAGRQPVTPSGR